MQERLLCRRTLREDTSEVPFYDSFIRPSSSAAVAATDKQTRGSKLIKNGGVNSAPAEEMKFSQISRGFALKSSCFTSEWMIYKNGVFKEPLSLTHSVCIIIIIIIILIHLRKVLKSIFWLILFYSATSLGKEMTCSFSRTFPKKIEVQGWVFEHVCKSL